MVGIYALITLPLVPGRTCVPSATPATRVLLIDLSVVQLAAQPSPPRAGNERTWQYRSRRRRCKSHAGRRPVPQTHRTRPALAVCLQRTRHPSVVAADTDAAVVTLLIGVKHSVPAHGQDGSASGCGRRARPLTPHRPPRASTSATRRRIEQRPLVDALAPSALIVRHTHGHLASACPSFTVGRHEPDVVHAAVALTDRSARTRAFPAPTPTASGRYRHRPPRSGVHPG